MEDTLVIYSEKRTMVKTLDSKMSNVSLYISLTLHFMIVLFFAFSGFNDNEQNSSSQAPSQMNIVQATLWTAPIKKTKEILPEATRASHESIVENTNPTKTLPKKAVPSIEQAKKKV
jgi:hypothetical protein